MRLNFQNRFAAFALGSMLLASVAMNTGCQVSIGGQTLPSSYYQYDDIQYFPKGPEFKLQKEAAALKAARAENSVRK